MEESHYYPFGLPMAGLSSAADNNTIAQRRKYRAVDYLFLRVDEYGNNVYLETTTDDPTIGVYNPKHDPNAKEMLASTKANTIVGGLGTVVGLFCETLEYTVRTGPKPFSPFLYKHAADAFARKSYSILGKEGSALLKGAKITTKALGGVNIAITVMDGVDNGWKNHHTADVAIGVATTFFVSGPWGWAGAAIFYTADFIFQARTGKSITEYVFD